MSRIYAIVHAALSGGGRLWFVNPLSFVRQWLQAYLEVIPPTFSLCRSSPRSRWPLPFDDTASLFTPCAWILRCISFIWLESNPN